MCLAQGPQRSDAGEARTRYPSVSSKYECNKTTLCDQYSCILPDNNQNHTEFFKLTLDGKALNRNVFEYEKCFFFII